MTLLRELMLADLERGLKIVRDGHEVVPAWRVLAPDGDFLILTSFDPDKPGQRERAFALVPRFMAWKLATGYVLTAETWLGPERTRSGEEAVLTIGVSHHERIGRDPAHTADAGALIRPARMAAGRRARRCLFPFTAVRPKYGDGRGSRGACGGVRRGWRTTRAPSRHIEMEH
jgi:hypothetical protein